MKYIVTGGAGFIGHNIVKQLEAQGHTCYVLDSLTDYGFISESELRYLHAERKKQVKSLVYQVDIRNTGAVELFFHGCLHVDAVIHLAAFPRQKIVAREPEWAADVMGPALVNLLEQTVLHKIPKFVYVSSSMVYGDFSSGVVETAQCNPIGEYAKMKLAGEQLVQQYADNNFTPVIIRPSAVYGELDVNDRVVSKFITSAICGDAIQVNGAGEVLDFTHVDDAAQGIALAAVNPAASGIYNITRSNPESATLYTAAVLIKQITASESQIVVNDRDQQFPTRGRLDISRAQQDLGFSPTVDIFQGFQRYYNWITNSKYWQTQLAADTKK